MSAHTPGRWMAAAAAPFVVISTPNGHYIGRIARQEDAHLVAAAPDLLDALKTAESALALAAGYANSEQRTMHAALETARAAIAKARGEDIEIEGENV